MTRFVSQGRDSWTARTGYQHTPRVPGPIQPMDYPRRSILSRLFNLLFKDA